MALRPASNALKWRKYWISCDKSSAARPFTCAASPKFVVADADRSTFARDLSTPRTAEEVADTLIMATDQDALLSLPRHRLCLGALTGVVGKLWGKQRSQFASLGLSLAKT